MCSLVLADQSHAPCKGLPDGLEAALLGDPLSHGRPQCAVLRALEQKADDDNADMQRALSNASGDKSRARGFFNRCPQKAEQLLAGAALPPVDPDGCAATVLIREARVLYDVFRFLQAAEASIPSLDRAAL